MTFEREDINIVLLEIILVKVDIISRIGEQCVAAVMGSGNHYNNIIATIYLNSNRKISVELLYQISNIIE